MLMGEFHHNLDDKKRIVIPNKLASELGDTVILTRGIDGCLFLYSKEEWDKIVNKLKDLPFTKKDARSFTRFFLSGATVLTFDKNSRINIPKPLNDYAKLEKECVIIGMNDRLEIWNKELFEEFLNNNQDSISDIAEGLFDMNL